MDVVNNYVVPGLAIMGASGLLTALLPRPSGPKGRAVFTVLDLLASNYMNARNAQAEPPKS